MIRAVRDLRKKKRKIVRTKYYGFGGKKSGQYRRARKNGFFLKKAVF